MVFSLTPSAATAMIDARSEVGAPDDWGIRFFVASDGPPGIAIDFVEAPELDDVVGGSGKLRTYVDAALDQQYGDATVDFKDVDGAAELVIRPHKATRPR